jgi:hypothetical protein
MTEPGRPWLEKSGRSRFQLSAFWQNRVRSTLLIGHLNLELIGRAAFIIRRCEQY